MLFAFDIVYLIPTRFLDTGRLSPETLVTLITFYVILNARFQL